MSDTQKPVEPYGRVTVHAVTGQQFFYPWPEPPYLDTAKECVTVYTTPPDAAARIAELEREKQEAALRHVSLFGELQASQERAAELERELTPKPCCGEYKTCRVPCIPREDALRSRWLPIESAPKDGTMFLCWVSAVRYGETDEGQQYEQDASQADFCEWRTQHDIPDCGWFEPMCGQIGDAQNVTHWMPLPPAPGSDPQPDPRDAEIERLRAEVAHWNRLTSPFKPVGEGCTCAGPDGPCEACAGNKEAWEEWMAERMHAGIDGDPSAAAELARLRSELDAVSAAIGTTRYMDPPDGGDVSLGEQVRRMRSELAEALESRSVPDGWQLVPVEPTPEMIAATPFPTNVTPNLGVACYRAMVAAMQGKPI